MNAVVRIIRSNLTNPILPHRLLLIRRATQQAMALVDPSPFPIDIKGKFPDERQSSPIVFASCDDVYFQRFARQLTYSHWKQAAPEVRLHLHLFEPTSVCLVDCEKLHRIHRDWFSFSYEGDARNHYGGPDGYYYASARFAALGALLERVNAPIFSIDVDAIIKGKLNLALQKMQSYDAAFFFRRSNIKPWRKILACGIYLSPNSAARLFMRRLAVSLDIILKKAPNWNVDQTAIWMLLQAYKRHKLPLQVGEVDPALIDFHFTPEGLIWTAKGKRKALIFDWKKEHDQELFSEPGGPTRGAGLSKG